MIHTRSVQMLVLMDAWLQRFGGTTAIKQSVHFHVLNLQTITKQLEVYFHAKIPYKVHAQEMEK